MTLRAALKMLLAAALALPVIECVLIAIRSLVLSMGDAGGAGFVGYIATACLIAWALSLIGLLIVLAAIESLKPNDDDT